MNFKHQSLTILLALAAISVGADWDQWRGPGRDGQVAGFKAPAKWPAKLTRSWKVEVGEGHSSPLLVGKRVFSFARQGDEEIARCLDLKDGHQIWSDHYFAPYEMNPAAAGHGKGPKATPVYRDGRLFTLGISGILSALDARSGKVLWRKEFKGAHKKSSPTFGTSMSPIVDRGLLIAHVGGDKDGELSAFDVKTGEVRWRWTGDGPGYASPIVITREGVRQLITQTQKMIVGLNLADGKLLWSLPFTTPYEQNSVTPVLIGDLVVFAGVRTPTFACRIVKSASGWKAEKAWETRDVTMYMSTAVASRGKLYGMSERKSGQMFVISGVDGKTLWTDAGRVGDNAAVLDAGDTIFALTPTADFVAYKKQGDTLVEAARYQVAESATWATPAIDGANLLVKDLKSIALWRMPN